MLHRGSGKGQEFVGFAKSEQFPVRVVRNGSGPFFDNSELAISSVWSRSVRL
jgi:hypothetical protein